MMIVFELFDFFGILSVCLTKLSGTVYSRISVYPHRFTNAVAVNICAMVPVRLSWLWRTLYILLAFFALFLRKTQLLDVDISGLFES